MKDGPIAPFDPTGGDYTKTHPLPPGPRPTEEEWRDIAAGVHAAGKLGTGFGPEPTAAEVVEAELLAGGMTAEAYGVSLGAEPWEGKYLALGWPLALAKAAGDHFQYACEVRGLGIIHFTEAKPAGNGWVRLDIDFGHTTEATPGFPYAFPRGVDVRLEDIRWVADAPCGS